MLNAGRMAQTKPIEILRALFICLHNSVLKRQGFARNSISAERPCHDNIVQVVGLRLSRDKAWFAIEFGWRFSGHEFESKDTYATLLRLGQIHGNPQRTDPLPPVENISHTCECLSKDVEREVIPLLNKTATAKGLIDSVNTGELSSQIAFGQDGGWNAYNRFLCYSAMKDKHCAKQSLQEILERWSAESDAIAFVRNRRDKVVQLLEQLAED